MSGLTESQMRNLSTNRRMYYRRLAHKCVDCHLHWHPLVMTFDHKDRSTKSFTLSDRLIETPIEFKREMDKCDVVCRNCHTVREMLRDVDNMKISPTKREKWRYFRALIPYLKRGGILNRNAHREVKI